VLGGLCEHPVVTRRGNRSHECVHQDAAGMRGYRFANTGWLCGSWSRLQPAWYQDHWANRGRVGDPDARSVRDPARSL